MDTQTSLPEPLNRATTELGRLPGIGPKGAARLAFHIFNRSTPDQVEQLAAALVRLKTELRSCSRCYFVTEKDLCALCTPTSGRDQAKICVVQTSMDAINIERAGAPHRGTYHVLGGLLSPIDGIGPAELHLPELVTRIESLAGTEVEVILATPGTIEGETTATYIHAALAHLPGVTVNRLGFGLPVGGDLEFADELTIGRAMQSRRAMPA